MASGLSMPVGFKNSTDGSFEVALNAIQSSRLPHFLGIDANGRSSVVSTTEPHGHLVLRGGNSGPNYDANSVAECIKVIEGFGIEAAIVVDCSHANHRKTITNKSQCSMILLLKSKKHQWIKGNA